MKSIKTKAIISILLICLLTVPLSGIIGVHADSPEDQLSQEVITYPSSEEELMPTAMASAMINPGYLVLKVSQTANLTATYNETSTTTTQPIWGAEDSSIVSLSTETGTTTTVTADEVGVTTIYFIKGEVSASIPVYVVESGISGTFYVENIFTKRLMDLSSASSEDGTVIQQRKHTSVNVSLQQWLISAYGNYYTIRSSYSYKYVGVESASNGAAVKQYSTINDNTKWIITKTPSGYYRFIPLSCARAGYSLSVETGGWGSGIPLYIYPYTNDSNTRDEWFLSKGFGGQTYRARTNTNDKTYYVMRPEECTATLSNTTSWDGDAITKAETSIKNTNQSDTTAMDAIRNTLCTDINAAFQSWLDSSWKNAVNATWSRETDFTGNGENKYLRHNQYRVVLRTGIGLVGNDYKPDYQLWYQTCDGSWACIGIGKSYSIHLPSTDTPFSPNSQGWMRYDTVGFFTSEIYSYILTFN